MTQSTIAQIRQALVAKFGARNYQIKSNGDVVVRCTMPNHRQHGWYLLGDINNIPALVGDINNIPALVGDINNIPALELMLDLR